MQLAMSAQINLNDLTNVYVLYRDQAPRGPRRPAATRDVSELNKKKAANSDAITSSSPPSWTPSPRRRADPRRRPARLRPSTKAKVDSPPAPPSAPTAGSSEYSVGRLRSGSVLPHRGGRRPTEFLVLVDEGVKLAGELAAATSAVSHVRSAMANMDYVRRKAHASPRPASQQDPTPCERRPLPGRRLPRSRA